jgi:hypothetical protein
VFSADGSEVGVIGGAVRAATRWIETDTDTDAAACAFARGDVAGADGDSVRIEYWD